MDQRKIEICAYSVQSAINAQLGGAYRVELCDNMIEGGTTPSFGTIKLARSHLDIKLHVIVRPRGGDFCYSDIEFKTMISDIESIKNLGAEGVVLGVLNPDGTLDLSRMRVAIDHCRPMSVTCHRAFDMVKDPFQSLEKLIELGVERILTSGQQQTAFEGKELIAELIDRAAGRIVIMPGSGVNENNIQELIKVTGAKEFHLSAKSTIPGDMEYRNDKINMGGFPGVSEHDIMVADVDKIKRIVNLIQL